MRGSPHGITVRLDRDRRPLVVDPFVGLWWNERGQASFAELLLEQGAHRRVFGHVLYLIARAIFDFLGVAVELHRRMECQVARWRMADVEVLVKPLVGRRDQAA